MRFLLDANLAPSLCRPIKSAGYDCVHFSRFLPVDAKDVQIAHLANEMGAVLMTKDADFVELQRRHKLTVPLVWLRFGNMTNRKMLEDLLTRLPRIVAAIESGEDLIEIR